MYHSSRPALNGSGNHLRSWSSKKNLVVANFRKMLNNGNSPPWRSIMGIYWKDYIVLLVLFAVLIWSETATPFHKTIYHVSDQELWRYSYPLGGNTVPSLSVPAIALLIPGAVFALYIFLGKPSRLEGHNLILGLFCSVLVNAVVTNIIKINVGRPRPHFAQRCWPDGNVVWAADGSAICSDKSVNPDEGRKSFPSGHTSWSMAGLGYLSFWLAGQLQVFDGSGHPWRLILALCPSFGGIMIGVSRVKDYWHHWEDVAVGFFLGLIIAYLAYRQHYPALTGPNSGEPKVLALANKNGILPESSTSMAELPLADSQPGSRSYLNMTPNSAADLV